MGTYAALLPAVNAADRDRLAAEAQAARAEIEAALDLASWPWSTRLSLWIDALVTLEEA